ncbi:tRNA (N6-threonylcarbamoyladenosine(37)-N6)-methyltransferase TrmO [bacterium]|nr:tRNA (N6-threonylcarbamoyladenosine(37)-N6)-methyltransferase TrmO [bacterium]
MNPPTERFTFTPIGTLHTPFTTREDMPIQPSGARGTRGTLELDPAFVPGLKDLTGFSHLILIYVFHKVTGVQLTVTPFLDATPHGLFATRAPKRPNPIGLSVVRLVAVEENRLLLEDVDMLDGTPVLDIKPYVPAFDQPADVRVGWLSGQDQNVRTKRSDDRFS